MTADPNTSPAAAGSAPAPQTPVREDAAPSIHVCCLKEVGGHAAALGPSRLISLVPGYEQPATPPGMPPENHLRLEIDDIVEPMPGLILPQAEHVLRLVDFYGRWNGQTPMLVHCAAGKSRSMAAALVGLAMKADLPEIDIARRMRQAAPHASPNPRIVALADDILQREGRLVAALEAMGEAQEIETGPLVTLSLAEAQC